MNKHLEIETTAAHAGEHMVTAAETPRRGAHKNEGDQKVGYYHTTATREGGIDSHAREVKWMGGCKKALGGGE